jgi:hypothetical protein
MISSYVDIHIPVTKRCLNEINQNIDHILEIIKLSERQHTDANEHDQNNAPDTKELGQIHHHLLQDLEHWSKSEGCPKVNKELEPCQK